MDFKGLNNNYSTILQNFANDLYEKDEDKVITKQEMTEYLFSIQNDAEFISLNISTSQAEAELNRLLNGKNSAVQDSTLNTEENSNNGELNNLGQNENNVSKLEELIKEYDLKINQANSNFQELKNGLAEAQKRYDEILEKTKKEKEKYENLEQKAENKNREYEKINKNIEKTQDKLIEDTKKHQQEALKKAENKYNPSTDGSWEEFAQKFLDDVAVSNYQGKLNNLINNSKSVSSELTTLKTKMSAAQLNLNNLQTQLNTQAQSITELNDEINAKTNEINETTQLKETTQTKLNETKQTSSIGNVTAASVLGMVPQAELDLVKEHNLDLKEQLPDGSPRYLIAKGIDDGIYHIYDNIFPLGVEAKNLFFGISLARKYCPDEGYDITSVGNGYIFGGKGDITRKTYYFDSCGNIKCNDMIYTTSSPLSLDINGDGVKTSSDIVDFDIDGDGVVDKINDSADAVLVFDKDGDGISGEDGSECFGNNTDIDGDGKADGYKDGFEALKAMAKKEGLIGENDSVLDEKDLKTLEDKYGLKIKTEGYNSEAKSLADVGITEINLADTDETTMLDNFDGNGNQLMKQQGATFKVNGETREYADIWHKKLDEEDIKAQQANNTSKTYTMSDFKADEEALNFKFNNNIFSDITSSQQKGRNVLNKASSTKLDNLVDIDSNFGNQKADEMEAEKEDDDEKKKKLNPFG